jgi:hypothetical protein
MQDQINFPPRLSNFGLLITFSLLIGPSNMVLAQQPSSEKEVLKLNIQLRPRAELRNGVFTPLLITQDPASFISQRNRIGLTYQRGNKISLGLQFQSVNVWGKDPQVQQTSTDINLYQAWAQVYLHNNLQLKIGRQILSYDDERILGALDWNNSGRKHDAALFRYQKGKFKTDIALAYNQNSERLNGTFYNDSLSQPYKSMEFAWIQYSPTNDLSFSAIAMNLDKQSRTDSLLSHQQTVGWNTNLKKKKFSAIASLYYQDGRANSKTKAVQRTSAWMGSLSGNYALSKKISAGLGSDYLSGKDMDNRSSTVSSFNPLFGTHHKFYGHMDYFYVSSPHKNVGLWDSYINTSYKSSANTTYQLALHHFEAAGKIINYRNKKAGSVLGHEIDLSFQHQLLNDVKLTGGYSQIFNTNSMRYVKSISENQKMKPAQNWVWLSINIQPEILLYEKSAH